MPVPGLPVMMAAGAGDGAFTHYRLNITAAANSPNGSTGMAEFELLLSGTDQIPTMTDYTTSGVTCSASLEASANTAWRTGDGVVDMNEWFTGSGSGFPQWLQYEFPTPVEIDAYSIQAHTGGNQQYTPTSFQLLGSNTGAFSGEETILDSRAGESAWGSGEKRTYSPLSP